METGWTFDVFDVLDLWWHHMCKSIQYSKFIFTSFTLLMDLAYQWQKKYILYINIIIVVVISIYSSKM